MTYMEYSEEKRRLEAGRDTAPNFDIKDGYFDALRKLEKEHPQAPGIGTHLHRVKEYSPADDGKSVTPMLYKRADINKLVARELAKYEGKLKADENRIRQEIEELKRGRK